MAEKDVDGRRRRFDGRQSLAVDIIRDEASKRQRASSESTRWRCIVRVCRWTPEREREKERRERKYLLWPTIVAAAAVSKATSFNVAVH